MLCVISGFRITSLILRDLESSKSRLIDFWEQRVRRIAPALNVWFAATLIAGWFLSLPGDYHRLGQATVARGLVQIQHLSSVGTDMNVCPDLSRADISVCCFH